MIITFNSVNANALNRALIENNIKTSLVEILGDLTKITFDTEKSEEELMNEIDTLINVDEFKLPRPEITETYYLLDLDFRLSMIELGI